ncbi:hypothetical protein AB6A40_004543 [Gnathostoma spinigerum]|uniref:Uncharacterized protein n=1 Tax=Gnathostoma spinigerum TaxID=75299 RepID=A0ABD6ECS3_9BILA
MDNSKTLFSIFLFLSMVFVSNALLGSYKNITVKGTLLCGYKSVEGAKVELYDHDRFDRDDLLATTKSNIVGNFEIFGKTRELIRIEPYLWITHSCVDNAFNKKCVVTGKYEIRNVQDYIGKTFNAGNIDLNKPLKKQSKKCKK